MKSWQIRLLGILAFALLVLTSAKFCAPQIQDDLRQRTTHALQQQGFEGITVEVSGLNVSLAGEAPTAERRAQAEAIVRNVWGPDTITNHIQLAAAPSPYTLSGHYDGQQLWLKGFVPGLADRDVLRTTASEQLGAENQTSELALGASAPENWTQAGTHLIRQLTSLQQGQFKVSGKNIDFVGKAKNESQRDAIVAQLTQLEPLGYQVHHSLSAPPPLPTCQQEFDRILDSQQVMFEPNSAAIPTSGQALLRALKDVATKCPQAHILVIGHTDNVGNEEDNLQLSSERAQAVVNQLIQLGIARQRLDALGKGASEPIADNRTPSGRARNRRIQFIVNTQDETP